MITRKILVTGGAGFIGTYLCRALVERGDEVRVLDLKAPRASVAGVEYLRGDVRDEGQLVKALKGVEAVYHFAAIVSVPLCQEAPVESYKTNLLATAQVLDESRAEGIRQGRPLRVVFASSAAIYGNSGKESISLQESETLTEPLSFYAAQKLGSEHCLRQFYEAYRLPVVALRFFNVYGQGQDPKSPYSGVISVFSDVIREGRALQLHGGGGATRDFIHVKDVARACVQALLLSEEVCDGRPINIGSGQNISIRALAEEMVKVNKKPLPMAAAPLRQGDVLHSRADISRARELLGWSPEIGLEAGLSELLRG